MLFRVALVLTCLINYGCATQNISDSQSLSIAEDLAISDINNLPFTEAGSDGSVDGVSVMFWDKLRGKNIRALTRNSRFPNDYSLSEGMSELDFVDSKGDKYAQRLQALLEVDNSGEYQFWISADESAELWVSTDSFPENKRLIAFVNKPSGYKVWDTYRTQKSKSLNLEAGVKYYFEVLHKEHLGTDYLTVAWSGPGFDREVLSTRHLDTFHAKVDTSYAYEDGYHNGYQAGSMLAPYDNSNPVPDQDGDGVPDFYENILGLDMHDASDASSDADGDMLTVREEYALLTNPKSNDTDADGLPDGLEVLLGLNAVNPADAYADLDNDGVNNLTEYQKGSELDNPDSIPVAQNVALSWAPPQSRTDGSPLQNEEIMGYKIYLACNEGAFELAAEIDSTDPLVWTATNLDQGKYAFVISTLTIDGVEGDTSNSIEIEI